MVARRIQQNRFAQRASALILAAAVLAGCFGDRVAAQGPPGAGGPGGPPGGDPAFVDPSFRDRLWEEGGPRLSGLSQGKLVREVQIVGNRSVSRHKILSHMQTRPDRSFDEKQLQQDIHELYRTELFRKITPRIADVGDGIIVRLEVIEQPTVSEVIFHGNKRLDDRMLAKHCGIEVGSPANPFAVDMARQRLIDLYKENGFNQVAIVVKEGNRAGDRRVFFEIAEGPLERIWSIDFIGNAAFSDALLRTKTKSRDARYGLTAYAFNKANLTQIEDDASLILAYYRSLGYFKARVDHRITYHEGSDFIDVAFVIDEGERFRVRNVTTVGNKFFTTELLTAELELKPGDYFNLARMVKDQRRIRNDFYGREGFVFVDVVAEPRFLSEPGMLDLVYRIEEGDRYRAGEINVHIVGDSSHTQHNVVLNLIGLREGQYIDLRELENSERRLRFSQIFETNPALGEPPRIEVRPPDEDPELFGY
ncbi:MAG: hypothetical protein D6753_17935 [Planctomycetota bacterium]|nr:MAG: hypothetical protein D6753_17935 [Planctomycetota bacterium]